MMKRLLSLLLCLSMLLSLMPVSTVFAEDTVAAAERAAVTLDTPTGLYSGEYSVTYNSAYLNWSVVTNATAYEVQYRLTTASDWTTFGTVDSNECTVTGLTCGKEYYFRVRAVADDGTTVSYSQWSAMVRNTPKPEEPWPYNVEQKTTTSVEITWSQVAGAQGYYIYRADNGGTSTLIKTFTGNTTFAYVDSGLSVGSTYVYEVCAYRKVDSVTVEGTHSYPMEIKLLPVAPTGVKATVASANSLKLTWNAVAGASSYSVYRATSSGGTYTPVATGLTGVTYTDTGLMTGASYYYYVTSVVVSGDSTAESEPSATVSASPVLQAPGNFSVTATTAESVTLTWSAVPLASGYRLYLSTDGESWTKADMVDLTDSETSYTWTGLTPSTKYYFRIFAYVTLNLTSGAQEDMVSNGSLIVNAYTNPSTPDGLVVIPMDYRYLMLQWDDNGEDVDGYEIYRSTDKSTYTLVDTIGDQNYYNSQNLTCGTTYYYKIRAYKVTADGTTIYSAYSRVVYGKPIPHAPQNVTATGLDGTSIKLTWEGEDGAEDPINGAQGYIIYQRVKGEDAFSVAAEIEGGSVMSYILTNMTPGVEMEFRVCAYRVVNGKKVEGELSAVVSAIAMPLAPTNVKVSLVNETSLKVTWAASKGATGYDLYMYVEEKIISEPEDGGYQRVARSGQPLEAMSFVISTAETNYTVTGLIPGYTYEFRVVPFVDANGTTVTGPASATASTSPRPMRPADLAGNATNLTSVTLTWSKTDFVANGLKGYVLYYSDDLAATWTKMVDLQDPEMTTYVDNTVVMGTTRMYRIRSYIYSDGVQVFSSFSSAISVVPKPRTATNLKAASDAFNTITLTFSGDLDPVRYLVYRSSTSASTGFASVGYVTAATAADLQFVDTGVEIGTTYWYKVRPVYNNGSQNFYGDWSEVVTAASRPGVPQNVTAVPTGVSTSKVSWEAVSGVTGYQVYRSSTENSGYKLVKSVSSSYVSGSDSGLTIGQTYYYRVRGYRIINGQTIYGAFSAPVKMVCAPVSPAKFKISSTTWNSVTLSWEAVEGASTFTINYTYASYPDDTGATQQVNGVKSVAGSKTSVTITNLPLGAEVTFQIVTNVTVGDDVITSDPASVVTGNVRPARVTGLKATSLAQGSNQLSWTAVEGATQYEVEFSYEGADGTWTSLGTTNNTMYRHDDTTVGEVIYYRVRAVGTIQSTGATVTGVWSDKVKLVSVPAKITDLTVKSTNFNRLRLDWTHSDGADGYEIYRSTKSTTGFALVKDSTAVYFNNTGLTCGSTYYYKVRAYVLVDGSRYYSDYSAVVSGKPVPNIPENVSVNSLTTTSMRVKWDAVSGADGYVVVYKDSTATSYTTAGETTGTYLTKKDLKVGRTYMFRVRAYRLVDGKRVYGAYSTVVDMQQTPPVPQNVTTANTGSTSIKVSWDKCQGVDGYEVHYSLTSGGPYTLKANVSAETATITGMEMGREAFIVVRSYGIKSNGDKEYSPFSAEVSRTPRPNAPTLKISTWDVTGITLTWNSISNATGYKLYGKQAASGSWTEVATLTGSNITSYRDSDVNVGSYHYYMIQTVTEVQNTDGTSKVNSQDSNVVYVQVVPAKVTLTVRSGGIDHINLSWTASAGSDQYVIMRSTSKTGTYRRVAIITDGSTSYADYDVVTGTTYYYKVIARCRVNSANVDSADSNIAYAKAQPGKVTNVKATRLQYNSITVTWDKVEGATGYQIYVRAGSASATRTLKRTVGDRTNTTITGLTCGKTYYVEVRALVGEAGGAYSEQAKIKVLPATPTSVRASATGKERVRVTWGNVSGATGYQVYRATSENGTYKLVATVTTNAATLTKQDAGVKYYYKVCAYRTVSGKKVLSLKSAAVACTPEP